MAEDRFMNLRPRVPWERDLGGMLGEMEGSRREREGGEGESWEGRNEEVELERFRPFSRRILGGNRKRDLNQNQKPIVLEEDILDVWVKK